MNEIFHKIAVWISHRVGSSMAFVIALLLIGSWLFVGITQGFTDTWLLVINTVCSIVTFLIVFLIQNTQNRESRAMQLKLNELIKSVKSARNDLVDLEELTDQELDELQNEFRSLRKEFVQRHNQASELSQQKKTS